MHQENYSIVTTLPDRLCSAVKCSAWHWVLCISSCIDSFGGSESRNDVFKCHSLPICQKHAEKALKISLFCLTLFIGKIILSIIAYLLHIQKGVEFNLMKKQRTPE